MDVDEGGERVIELLEGNEPSREWLGSPAAQNLLSKIPRREQLYQAMHPSPSPQHAELLRALLAHEVAFRDSDEDDPGDAFDNLYWCALLLHQLGRLEDVLPLWRAKMTNFDTGCGMDIQFLVGPGVERTLAYLVESSEPDAAKAYECIAKCHAAGELGAMDEWLALRRAYFGERGELLAAGDGG